MERHVFCRRFSFYKFTLFVLSRVSLLSLQIYDVCKPSISMCVLVNFVCFNVFARCLHLPSYIWRYKAQLCKYNLVWDSYACVRDACKATLCKAFGSRPEHKPYSCSTPNNNARKTTFCYLFCLPKSVLLLGVVSVCFPVQNRVL